MEEHMANNKAARAKLGKGKKRARRFAVKKTKPKEVILATKGFSLLKPRHVG
jgi:hypothetical protein